MKLDERLPLTQADVAFLLAAHAYSVETGNGRRLKPAYAFFLADRIFGPGVGQARAQELRQAGHFVFEDGLWLHMDYLTPLSYGYLPGEKPKTVPTPAEYKNLALWQATGLEDPSERHWLVPPPESSAPGFDADADQELRGSLTVLARMSDRAGGRALTQNEVGKAMRGYLMEHGARMYLDRFASALTARLRALQTEMKQRGFCVTGAGSNGLLTVTAAAREFLAPAPSVPQPVAELPAANSSISEEIEDPVIEPIVQKGGDIIPAPVEEPVIEEPVPEPIPDEPVSVVPAGELVRFPRELVRPSTPKNPMGFTVPGQSNPDTFLATHRHLEIRFDGAIPSAVSGALCGKFWRAYNPLPARGAICGGSGMRSRHRWGEKGNDWFATERGLNRIKEFGLVSSLSDDQADEFIRLYGYVPRHEVDGVHDRVRWIDQRQEEIVTFLINPVDFKDSGQHELWNEQWDLKLERERLLHQIAGRKRLVAQAV